MMRDLGRGKIVAILALFSILAGCSWLGVGATTPLGQAIEFADIQKQLVVRSAVEFEKLHLQGKLAEEPYAKGRAAYEQWAAGEKALAESLIAWKKLGNASSEQRLKIAISLVGNLGQTYFTLIGQFVDLNAVKQKLLGG